MRQSLFGDVAASLVVFLVALPLCTGVALASGVPVELGIITGIVGGLVTGMLPGSSLQVSGPAAGMTVLVFEAVTQHGVGVLTPVVLGAGLIQIGLGLLRLGRFFQAISLSVVQGMLTGIGLLLVFGQVYPLAGHPPVTDIEESVIGLPGLAYAVAHKPDALAAVGIGVLTIVAVALWPRLPAPVRAVPGSLVAVIAATMVATALDLLVPRVRIGTITEALRLSDMSTLALWLDPEVLGLTLTFALIASAESLFSAAAVDRMHDGPRTRFNAELVAQGAGNSVCGLLGALPLTAVIVRSAANVQAGARTKLSRVLHGVWLLAFVALLPGVLELVPVAALAGVLLYSGWKLANPSAMAQLWRRDRRELVVMLGTAAAVLTTDLLIGVLFGLLAATVKCAWEVSHLVVAVTRSGDISRVRLAGNATFLRLPRITAELEALPRDVDVELDLRELRHIDHACQEAIGSWVSQRRGAGGVVQLFPPTAGPALPQLAGQPA